VREGLPGVEQRPAADHRVEAEDEEGGDGAEHADAAPPLGDLLAPGHDLDAGGGIAASASTDRELGEHHRHDHQREPSQVDEDERATAVRTDLVRELPDAPDADGGTDGGEDEAGAAPPLGHLCGLRRGEVRHHRSLSWASSYDG
jgi:hypothetical protein